VNWRAIGCGTIGAVAFVVIGLIGLWRVAGPADCPPLLPYEPSAYRPAGDPTSEPRLEGVADELELAGSTSFGLARWDVWVEPGRVPPTAEDPLPQRIVLECGDGSFQAYQRGAE
jgi:hypothetical protein